MKIRPLHFNVPQIKTMLVDATETYVVAGRGVGKSSGVIAPWLIRRAAEMPRSMGGIVGATFQQLLVRTLPPVVSMWKRMGYQQNIHFIIGQDPLSNKMSSWRQMWKWEDRQPYTMPLDSKHAIYWFNGSCQVLISQDRIGSSNGLSLAYVSGDEAKLLNKARFDEEVMPTLRGDRQHFGSCVGYGGQLFTTDMPTTAKSRWILEKAQEMDVDQISQIIENQILFNHLQKQYHSADKNLRISLKRRLQGIQIRLNHLRIGAKHPESENRRISTFYLEASALDNLDVLGPQYLKRMQKSLTDLAYKTSILNQRINQIEGGYYSKFDPDHHGTDWFDYNYLDSFIGRTAPTEDSRQDAGIDPSSAIDIACDYGTFNCLVTGQRVGMEYRLFRGFHRSKGEGLIQNVVQDFVKYYAHHGRKVVNYYYDHTAVAGIGNTEQTYHQTVIDELTKADWTVNECYVGRTASPGIRYKVINTLLSEEDPEALRVRYSRSGLPFWEIAMGNCDVREGKNGFEKDKSAEKDKDQDQRTAPHYTDASDNLLFYAAAQNKEDSGSLALAHIR